MSKVCDCSKIVESIHQCIHNMIIVIENLLHAYLQLYMKKLRLYVIHEYVKYS